MNCFDCAAHSMSVTAVGVCADCGAGVCLEHAHVTARWLTRTAALNRTVTIEPPARTVRCSLCQAARNVAPAPVEVRAW
jgi:LSD1 subclass zinc finger protein